MSSTPVTTEELGVSALPADATPAQRARAEAFWRPVAADQPCRCSGGCDHGTACEHCGAAPGLIHTDRYPGSLIEVTAWADDYQCGQCGDVPACEVGVELPGLPWGAHDGDGSYTVYADVRHPNVPQQAHEL